MATIKNTLETNFTSKGAPKVVKETEQIGKAQTRLGQASASAGRSFSAQSQGLGGVVGIYAAAAANIFALTAAFQALNAAAQFETIIRGTNQLATSVGTSAQEVIGSLKNITDGQLTLVEASKNANLALSAGFNVDQIEQLGEVALKASRALGRNLSDSFQRLTRGAIKLEPELLDELGIFTRIEPAVEAYALAVGKSVSQLTQFERRQAFANQVIKDGNAAFEEIDTTVQGTQEVFETLVANFADLAIITGSLVADTLRPFAEFLDKDLGNRIVLLGAIGLLVFNNLKGVIAGFVTTGLAVLSSSLDGVAKKFEKVTSKSKNFAAETQAAADAFVGQGAFAGAGRSEGKVLKEKLGKGQLSTREALALEGKMEGFRKAEISYQEIIKQKRADGLITIQQQEDLIGKSVRRQKALAMTTDLVDKKLKSASGGAKLLGGSLNMAATAAKGLAVGVGYVMAGLNILLVAFTAAQFLASLIFDIDLFEKVQGLFAKIGEENRRIRQGAELVREANLENNSALERTLQLEKQIKNEKLDDKETQTIKAEFGTPEGIKAAEGNINEQEKLLRKVESRNRSITDNIRQQKGLELAKLNATRELLRLQDASLVTQMRAEGDNTATLKLEAEKELTKLQERRVRIVGAIAKITENMNVRAAKFLQERSDGVQIDQATKDSRFATYNEDIAALEKRNGALGKNNALQGIAQKTIQGLTANMSKYNGLQQAFADSQAKVAEQEAYLLDLDERRIETDREKAKLILGLTGAEAKQYRTLVDNIAAAKEQLALQKERLQINGFLAASFKALEDGGLPPDVSSLTKGLVNDTGNLDIANNQVIASFRGITQVLAELDETGNFSKTTKNVGETAQQANKLSVSLDLVQSLQDKLNSGTIRGEKATQQLAAVIATLKDAAKGDVNDAISNLVGDKGDITKAVKEFTQLEALNRSIAKDFTGSFGKLGKLFTSGMVSNSGKIARNTEEQATFQSQNLSSLTARIAGMQFALDNSSQEVGLASKLGELKTLEINIAKRAAFQQLKNVQAIEAQVKAQEKAIQIEKDRVALGALKNELQFLQAILTLQKRINSFFEERNNIENDQASKRIALAKEVIDAAEESFSKQISYSRTLQANQEKRNASLMKEQDIQKQNLQGTVELVQLEKKLANIMFVNSPQDITKNRFNDSQEGIVNADDSGLNSLFAKQLSLFDQAQVTPEQADSNKFEKGMIEYEFQSQNDIIDSKIELINREQRNAETIFTLRSEVLKKEEALNEKQANENLINLQAKESELIQQSAIIQKQLEIADQTAILEANRKLFENSLLRKKYQLLKAQIEADNTAFTKREDQLSRNFESTGTAFNASQIEDAYSINIENVNKLIEGVDTLDDLTIKSNAQQFAANKLNFDLAQTTLLFDELSLNNRIKAAAEDLENTKAIGIIRKTIQSEEFAAEQLLRGAIVEGLDEEITLNNLTLAEKLRGLELEEVKRKKLFEITMAQNTGELLAAAKAADIKGDAIHREEQALRKGLILQQEAEEQEARNVRLQQLVLNTIDAVNAKRQSEINLSRQQLSIDQSRFAAAQQLLSLQAQSASMERGSALKAAQGDVSSAQAGAGTAAKTQISKLENVLNRYVLNEQQATTIRLKIAEIERNAAFAGVAAKKKVIELERVNAIEDIKEKRRILSQESLQRRKDQREELRILKAQQDLDERKSKREEVAYNQTIYNLEQEKTVLQNKKKADEDDIRARGELRKLENTQMMTQIEFVRDELITRKQLLREQRALVREELAAKGVDAGIIDKMVPTETVAEREAFNSSINGMNDLSKQLNEVNGAINTLTTAQVASSNLAAEVELLRNVMATESAVLGEDRRQTGASEAATDMQRRIDRLVEVGAEEMKIAIQKSKNLTLESKEVRAAFDRKMKQLGIEGAAADAAYKITVERLKYQASFQAKLHELAKGLATTLVDGLGAAIHKIFDNIAEGEKSLKEGLSEIGREVFKDIRKQTLETTVVAPFKEGVTGLISSALGVDVGKTKGIDNLTVTGEGAALVKDVDDNGPGKLKEKIQEKGMTFFDEFKTRSSDVFTSMTDGVGKFGRTALDTFGGLGNSLKNIFVGEGGIMKSLSGFMDGLFTGSGNGVGSSIFNTIAGLFGPAAATGGLVGMRGVRNMASGGQVNALRDRVPTMLEPGEFVMRKPAAKSIGTGNLSRMNATGAAGMGNVQFNIVNEGSAKEAEQQGQPKFDADKIVVDVVMRDLQSNGPIRNALRSG